MELKEFIENTLMDIIEGVKNAQNKASQVGASIAPPIKRSAMGVAYTVDVKQLVEFEVTLTESTTGTDKKGIGVFLSAVSLGASNTGSSENAALTKVRFSVPVILPTQEG